MHLHNGCNRKGLRRLSAAHAAAFSQSTRRFQSNQKTKQNNTSRYYNTLRYAFQQYGNISSRTACCTLAKATYPNGTTKNNALRLITRCWRMLSWERSVWAKGTAESPVSEARLLLYTAAQNTLERRSTLSTKTKQKTNINKRAAGNAERRFKKPTSTGHVSTSTNETEENQKQQKKYFPSFTPHPRESTCKQNPTRRKKTTQNQQNNCLSSSPTRGRARTQTAVSMVDTSSLMRDGNV